jgi:hypothetical protein
MAAFYDLLTDFGVSPGGTPSVVPYWVIAVVPFKNRVTFDRSKLPGLHSASFSNALDYAVEEDDQTIVLSSEVARISTSSDKRSHVASMTASLWPTRPLLREVHSGDWVFAWIVNDRETRDSIVERLKKGEPCNQFKDGLKFVGRCAAPRQQFQRSPDGQLNVMYSITARGFSEFDSQILYFPQMERQEIAIGQWAHKLALFINEITSGGAVDINYVVPKLLERLLGSGPASENGPARTPNTLYVVPMTAARILGKKRSSTPGTFTYADLLEAIIGVQEFANGNTQDHRVFLPEVQGSAPIYRTKKKMLGKFLPFPPAFDNKAVWSVLGEYLNPSINEMYVTLRANREGSVVPHFIMRQMPFTTPANKAAHGEAKYLDLPRWKLDDTLVVAGDLGESDAVRFNYVHLMGVAPTEQTNAALSFLQSPPIWDEADIKRSGLRPFTMVVNCTPEEALHGPKEWARHAADFLMGQHLTWSGSLSLVGVQAPIAIGDNCEYRGVVYHIEGVNHEAGISPSGQRYSYTTLALSHGMSSEDTIKNAQALGVDKLHEAQYPGLAKKSGYPVEADDIRVKERKQ